MKKLLTSMICLIFLLSGCGLIVRNIPDYVSVKDYDGRFIGDHTKRNDKFLDRYKKDAEKIYKDRVKNLYGRDVKITLTYPYSWRENMKEITSDPRIMVIGTVDYDIPFQQCMSFKLKNEKSKNLVPADKDNWTPAITAMIYKRYETDFESARLKFKKEVESEGYFPMNKELRKRQNCGGVSKQYLNFYLTGYNESDALNNSSELDDYKFKYRSMMNMKGVEFKKEIDELMKKNPELTMQTDFISYYKNKKEDNVKKYAWNIQEPTNETMSKVLGYKQMFFIKDKVSAENFVDDGRILTGSGYVDMEGGTLKNNEFHKIE